MSLRGLIDDPDAPGSRDALVGSMVQPRPNALRPERLGPQSILRPEFAFFVRTARWHYIWNSETDSDSLYDIVEDPEETRDVADAHPEQAQHLRAEIEAWHADVQKPRELPAL